MTLTGADASAAAESMRRIVANNDTWELLYWRPSVQEVWFMSYPDSGHHGGGAPQLDRVEGLETLAAKLRDPGWVADDPNTVVELLVDRWCERRALRPLRHILSAWPNFGLTGGYAAILDALSRVRSLARDDLDEAEVELAHLAQNGIERVLQRR